MQGLRAECYLGKKELKGIKKQCSWGRILQQVFDFRGSNCQRTEPPGCRPQHRPQVSLPGPWHLCPKTRTRGLKYPQILLKPNLLFFSVRSLFGLNLIYSITSFLPCIQAILNYIWTEKSVSLPLGQRPRFSQCFAPGSSLFWEVIYLSVGPFLPLFCDQHEILTLC